MWRYKWLVAASVLLAAVAGYGWSMRQVTLYEGVSRVLLNRQNLVDTNGALLPGGDPDRYVRNQAEIITSAAVIRRAAQLSRSDVSPAMLSQRLDVDPAKDTDLVTIRIRDRTREGAAKLATAFGQAYQEVIDQQAHEAADKAVKELRRAESELQARLTDLEPPEVENPSDPAVRRERDAINQQLKAVADKMASLIVNANLSGSSGVYLERAAVPDQPVQPLPRRTTAVGAILGLIVSGALAWWLNGRRRSRPQNLRPRPPHDLARGTPTVPPARDDATAAPANFPSRLGDRD
jgi:uncharacterized protein involved in exopolysaccharide biosynthesis